MSFHLFRINELYSNSTGSIQFIELTIGDINGESFWQGQSIDVIQGNAVHSFRFTTNLPNPNTANKSALIATQGFANLNFIAPDYIVPDEFLLQAVAPLSILQGLMQSPTLTYPLTRFNPLTAMETFKSTRQEILQG